MAKEYYTSPISLTSQFYFCPVPLRLDTFSGCVHNCSYCFANNSLQKAIASENNLNEFKKEFMNCKVKPTKLQYVKNYFDIAFEGKKNNFSNQEAIAIELIKHKVPIHFGGMSDPLQPLEEQENITYEVLKLLKKYDYPVIFSTKGKLILSQKYFDLIKDYKNFALQISLIDDRQEVIDILEPNAMSVQERLQAFKMYSGIGKWTACRIQPFIIGLTDSRIISLLDKLQEAGVKHVMVEGLKFMSGNKLANKRISKAFKVLTGKEYDLEAYYKAIGGVYSGVDLELPSWRKYVYVEVFKEELAKRGMTFGCADNDLRFLGTDECCCGIKNLEGFNNTLRHNTGTAVFKALANKEKVFDMGIIAQEYFPEGRFRLVMSNELALKRFNDAENLNNRPISELFNKAWMGGGKNSPCDMCNVKYLGCGKYKFLNAEELNEVLKNRGNQKTLF